MQFSMAFKINFMDRRTMLKELALGSGLLLMPRGLSLFSHKKPVQIIVIGDLSTLFMKDFYNKDKPNIYYTYIGWKDYNPFDENRSHCSFIEYDLSTITKENGSNNKRCQQLIIDALLPGMNYVFVTNLIKPQIELSRSIIQWVVSQSIDFRFMGISPLFNYSLIKIAKFVLKDFENDSRVSIIDVTTFLNNLDGDTLFTQAAEELDSSLSDILYQKCLSF